MDYGGNNSNDNNTTLPCSIIAPVFARCRRKSLCCVFALSCDSRLRCLFGQSHRCEIDLISSGIRHTITTIITDRHGSASADRDRASKTSNASGCLFSPPRPSTMLDRHVFSSIGVAVFLITIRAERWHGSCSVWPSLIHLLRSQL